MKSSMDLGSSIGGGGDSLDDALELGILLVLGECINAGLVAFSIEMMVEDRKIFHIETLCKQNAP